MTYPTDYINKIINGDCLEVLKNLPDCYVNSIVTDPPAGIGFMGKEWDDDKGGRDNWIKWLSEVMAEGLRVLKPGGHALVWALPRTSHWTGMALENAGFEVRDCVYHLFGSGFPKSLDISKAIDKQAGMERKGIIKTDGKGKDANIGQFMDSMDKVYETGEPITPEAKQWEGWGTALKPAVECWWLVRKPLSENTIAENVLKHGTGGLNIDGTRIGVEGGGANGSNGSKDRTQWRMSSQPKFEGSIGRFPANLIHDGSDVILAEFAKAGERTSGKMDSISQGKNYGIYGKYKGMHVTNEGDTGSAARFFYTAKPSSSEKNLLYGDFEEKQTMGGGGLGLSSPELAQAASAYGSVKAPAKNFHPTVKAQSLMCYLIKLITPPKGIVLDMFAGSGSTLLAAKNMGHRFIGIEIDPEYVKICEGRLKQQVLNF